MLHRDRIGDVGELPCESEVGGERMQEFGGHTLSLGQQPPSRPRLPPDQAT
ncbi:hypothetical protein ACFPRL_30790 [Pseudoclavibacter helvolus]